MDTPQISRSLHVQRFLAGAIGGLAMSSLGLVSVLLGVLGCLTGFALGWFAVDLHNRAGLFARRSKRAKSNAPRSIRQSWREFWSVELRHNAVRTTGSIAMSAFVLASAYGIVVAFIMSEFDFADIDAFVSDVNNSSRSVISQVAITMLTVVVMVYGALASVATLIILTSIPFVLLKGEIFDEAYTMRELRMKDVREHGTARFAIGYWRRCIFLTVGLFGAAFALNIGVALYFILVLAVKVTSGFGLAVVSGVRALLNPERNIIVSVLATLCGGTASLLWLMPRLDGPFAVTLGSCFAGLVCGALSMSAPLIAHSNGLPRSLERVRDTFAHDFDSPFSRVERMTEFLDVPVEAVFTGYIKRFDLEYLA